MLNEHKMFINWLVMVAVVLSSIRANINDKFIYKEESLDATNPVVINVSVFLIKLDGMLAYILTKQQNSSYHSIIMEFDKDNIHISFNGVKKKATVSSFCGCVTCTRTPLQFVVFYSPSNIEFECNGNRSETFDRHSYATHNFDSKIYPFPTKWNGEQKIFAWIGNVGPFTGANNKTWLPLSSQLKACINHLQIGDEKYLATSNHSRCDADVCGSMSCILLGGTDVALTTKYHAVTTLIKYSAATEMSTTSRRTTTTTSSPSTNGSKINFIQYIIICALFGLFVVLIATMIMVYRIRSSVMKNEVRCGDLTATYHNHTPPLTLGLSSQGYGVVSDDGLEYDFIGNEKSQYAPIS